MADRVYESITFENNITPLNERNLNQLSGNIDYVYNVIKGLIPNSKDRASPLPDASGDGLIRYVLTVSQDMIYTPEVNPPREEGRYFVAVPDEIPNRGHLEIGRFAGDDGDIDEKYTQRKGGDAYTHYTDHAGDACTHDKLFVCENTNKCYCMISPYGGGTVGHIDPGTTKQSPYFMHETAEAARTIFQGNRAGSTGFSHTELLRYRVVVMNFNIYNHGDYLLSVAFNPGWVKNSVLYVPLVLPKTVSGDNVTDTTSGVLKIYDNGSTQFTFSAFVGEPGDHGEYVAARDVNIEGLVGVADIKVDS